jgi:[ribosomal protein S5]-alanine N-acetyltransferase
MKDEIRQAFDDRAQGYKRSDWHRALAEGLIDLAPIREGDRVLDAGAGTGLATLAAARRVGDRGRVIGIDLSPGMLEVAKERCAQERITNIELITGDATALEAYDEGSFDAVLCSAALLYMPLEEALASWRRVLRSSGFLAFSGMKLENPRGGHLFREEARRAGLSIEDPASSLGTIERCQAALLRAGYALGPILESSVEMSETDVADAWIANLASPAHAAVRTLDSDRLERMRIAYQSALEREDPAALRRAHVLYAIGRKRGGLPRSDRLVFRRWSEEDLDLATKLWGDPQVTALIDARGALGRPEVEARLRAELDHDAIHGVQYWPVFHRESGELVGCAGIRPRDVNRRIYELGFHLLPGFWGRGLATEAASAAVRFASSELRASALFAGHHPKNDASKRVLSKLGFRFTHEELYAPTGLHHPCYLLKVEGSPRA